MKTNRKMLRMLALMLSVLMLGGAFATVMPFIASAADESGNIQYPISGYNPSVECPDPIPMLCIVVNFDANGNGMDDNADGRNVGEVQNKDSDMYGEQWCHFNHDVWYNMLFGKEGQTLYNYYMLMSNDKFYFYPAEETYADPAKNGVVNDGIVEVNVEGPHLSTINSYVYYYKEALGKVDEYVDFSKFDKNGNGKIDERELIISFINGGAELAQTPYGKTNEIEVFRSRAYYRDDDGTMLYMADGYEVGKGGIFTTGSWSYNSSRSDKATEFAVWAHELGHYLGAPDYYDTAAQANAVDPGYHFVTGYYSLMGKGCHGGQPSHLDPYTMTSSITGYGFYTPERVTQDGEYTLYSKTSDKGTYNIIKICTPNPGEYYLIENRYVSSDYEGEAFDKYGINDKQGILIWHVDENIHKRVGNAAANNKEKGYDPTLAVYATNTNNMVRTASQVIKAAFGNTKKVFNVSDYKFPVSKTWYTSLTEAEAELVKDLKIEIVSDLGEEMKIKVTGAYELKQTPTWSAWEAGVTPSSLSVIGILETLNYSTLNSVKCELVETSSKTVIKTDNVVLDGKYQFKLDYTGLKADTDYTVRITSDTSNGEGVYEKSFYTYPEPVEKTQAKVTIYANADKIKKTNSKTNIGECVKITDVMATKKGYKLVGWYLDEALTTPFDITKPLASADDFSIYAKWVADADAATLTLVGAQADGVVYAAEVGGKFTAPAAKAKTGYTFGGWYADAAFATAFDFDAAAAGAGEVKIYAKWLDANGNVADPDATTTGTTGTTAPAVDPGASGDAGSSCGSSIASSAVAVTALIGLGAGFIRRKKEQ